MTVVWTSERIAKLSTVEVKALASNASNGGNDAVVGMCQDSLDSRRVKPRGSSPRPEGFVRVTKSSRSKVLEQAAAASLVQLAQKLTAIYDLSKERARALSDGSSRFIPHSLTDSKGNAKVGGAQKSGVVVFDRYLSYRLGDQVFALLALLQAGEEAQVQYHVVGPACILTEAVHISELRPYLTRGTSIGLIKFAEEFDSFGSAAKRYTNLLELVAPKR